MIHSYFFLPLQKVLGTYDLISLGVGSCAGTGMYLVSGMVAKTIAGPAVVLSYTIAGLAALLSALCYAELGVRVPHTTGSAYVYTYVTVGEFVAFIIGKTFICSTFSAQKYRYVSGGDTYYISISRPMFFQAGT